MQNYFNTKTVLISLSVFVLSLVANAQENQAKPVYGCCHISQADVIAGFVDSKVWSKIPAASIARLSQSLNLLNPVTKTDLSGTWKAAWTNTCFYLQVTIADDKLLPYTKGGLRYCNDVVELFFDFSYDYRSYFQYSIVPFGIDNQGHPDVKLVIPAKLLIGQGVHAKSTRTASGYVLEMAILLKHFFEISGIQIGDGTIIGFDVSIHDLDTKTPSPNNIKSVMWSGNGSNWMDASQNGELHFLCSLTKQAVPSRNDKAIFIDNHISNLWPNINLIQGRFELSIPCQSYSNTKYLPWHLGEIRCPWLEDASIHKFVSYKSELQPTSLGEHLETGKRYIYETLNGFEDGELRQVTHLVTPYHPARAYTFNSKRITFFSRMTDFEQPSGPSWIAFQTSAGVQFRLLNPDKACYTIKKDGELTAGWILIGFRKIGDTRANEMPILLCLDESPEAIIMGAANGVNSGIHIEFKNDFLHSVTMLPLFGVKGISSNEVDAWIKNKSLPAKVCDRASFWGKASRKLPISATSEVQYDKDKSQFAVKYTFSYSQDISKWPETPILLNPVPTLLASSFRLLPFGIKNLINPDYPTFYGPFVFTENTGYTMILKAPRLTMVPRINMDRLEKNSVAKKYIKELVEIKAYKIIANKALATIQRKNFMPHPLIGDDIVVLPYLPQQQQNLAITAIQKGLRDGTFNPKMIPLLYPVKPFSLGDNRTYRDLTVPYGCPEPYWNIVYVLKALSLYSWVTNDYEPYEKNWTLIKSLSKIIWDGGFAHYRYDGGIALGEALKGLVRAAEKIGDWQFFLRSLYLLTEYCNTIPGHFLRGQWAESQNLWSPSNGISPCIVGPVQCITRQGFLPLATNSVGDFSQCWDASYALPEFLAQYSKPEIECIENRLVPKYCPNWYESGASNLKNSAVNRFIVHALILRDSIPELQKYLSALKGSLPKPCYIVAVAAMLQRINEDIRACCTIQAIDEIDK